MKFKIVRTTAPDGELIDMMYNDEGMIVGCVAGATAQFGEDPKDLTMRGFIDHDSALSWAKKSIQRMVANITELNAGVKRIEWELELGDKRIVPAASLVMPGGRKM